MELEATGKKPALPRSAPRLSSARRSPCGQCPHAAASPQQPTQGEAAWIVSCDRFFHALLPRKTIATATEKSDRNMGSVSGWRLIPLQKVKSCLRLEWTTQLEFPKSSSLKIRCPRAAKELGPEGKPKTRKPFWSVMEKNRHPLFWLVELNGNSHQTNKTGRNPPGNWGEVVDTGVMILKVFMQLSKHGLFPLTMG